MAQMVYGKITFVNSIKTGVGLSPVVVSEAE